MIDKDLPIIESSSDLACLIEAIPADERVAHARSWEQLLASNVALNELENGFEFVLPVDQLVDASQLVARERLCCGFLDFQLNVPSKSETLNLQMTGGEGVKQFLATVMSTMGNN